MLKSKHIQQFKTKSINVPILSETVMMLRDMVDSVMVLNDEHC